MRILVLASTFPRWEGDTVPPFVHRLSAGLAVRGHEMHVLAPYASGAARAEEMDGLRVHRFRYAPSRMELLCYDGGILENLRRHRARWGLVPPFMSAQLAAMLALGFTTRYSGTDAAMGLAFAHTGPLYPFFGTMLGWLGVSLTGSDTASNVLFGGLQRITSEQLGLNPNLMASANSSGGVMGKMIDAQSIVVASTAESVIVTSLLQKTPQT